MGIVGYGRIGRRVGAIARALGMTVIANTRNRPPGNELDDGTQWTELEALFECADVVSLHCPQTSQNTRFVNRALLGRMKPAAFLLNTARGGLIDEPDLAEALGAGRLAGAALDVVSQEPIRPDNPLLKAPNCLITPHMGWAAVEARRRLMRIAAQNVQAFLSGSAQNVVGN